VHLFHHQRTCMLSSVLLLPSGSIKARHRRPFDPHGQARSVSVVLSTCLAGVVTEGTSCLTRQSEIMAPPSWPAPHGHLTPIDASSSIYGPGHERSSFGLGLVALARLRHHRNHKQKTHLHLQIARARDDTGAATRCF
jgi:hypothetical protein